MRGIRKTATVLRVIGVILLFIAIVLSIYALAGNNEWGLFSEKTSSLGMSTGISARASFDRDYYLALSEASGSRNKTAQERQKQVLAHFTHYETDEQNAAAELLRNQTAQQLTDLENSFDLDAFLARYEQRESLVEQQQIKKLITEFDEISLPKTGGGKKINLKLPNQVSSSATLEAAYAARPEGECSYFEYLTVLRRMTQKDLDNGNAIKSMDAWMQESFTEDAFQAELALTLQEEKAEEADNLLDRIANAAEALPEGAAPDWKALLHEAYQGYIEDQPDNAPTEETFSSAAMELIASPAFAGTRDEITATIASDAQARQKASLSAWLPDFASRVVTDADARATINVVGIFWWMTANVLWFWIAGIALLILATVIEKLLNAALIKKLSRDEYRVDVEEDELLRVSHLKQYFRSGTYVNKAVDDVSFSIRKGEVFGLVGESGCGKTTTGRTIINLYDPTEGNVYFQGLRVSSTQNGLPVLIYQLRAEANEKIRNLKEDLKDQIKKDPASKEKLTQECKAAIREVRTGLTKAIDEARMHALESAAEKSQCVQKYRELRQAKLTAAFEAEKANLSGEELAARQRRYDVEMKVAAKDNIMTRMQMVFQDPIASINPRMTVREIIAEGLIIRGITDKEYIDNKVYEMLELVGLVREHADRYPHEFSGGQRQRIGIARAIVMEPDLIIADEPISALDVSIQAQVINLMNDLRRRMGLTIMFIAHNLSVVKYFSDRIGVMYYGHIVELTTSEELFAHPLHPYTKSLLSAIPYPDPHHEKVRKRIEYNPATAHDYSVQQPTLREIVPGHFILCNDAEYEQYRKELGL